MKKNIFISGSTDGIGKLTAIKYAENNYQVLVHGRSKKKVQSVVQEIKDITGNLDIHGFTADLSELKQVTKLGEDIQKKVAYLSILINNAGVYSSNTPISIDGYDMRFAVNFIAPVVLTHALLPCLKKYQYSKILNLSSAAQSSIDWQALTSKKTFSVSAAYSQSKLALTMWSINIAKELQKDTMLIFPINPGSLLNTKMVRENFSQTWAGPEKGANILLELGNTSEHDKQSGTYFDNDSATFKKAHPDAYNVLEIDKMNQFLNEILIRE